MACLGSVWVGALSNRWTLHRTRAGATSWWLMRPHRRVTSSPSLSCSVEFPTTDPPRPCAQRVRVLALGGSCYHVPHPVFGNVPQVSLLA